MYGVRIASGPTSAPSSAPRTMADFELPIRAAHIGWTAYDPRVWAGAVNPETKLLMLTGEAFDHGFGRVRLQADSVNERSRAAILKLGAQFEGVLRRARLRADGSLSGTAVYSILDDEWPAVRAGLEAAWPPLLRHSSVSYSRVETSPAGFSSCRSPGHSSPEQRERRPDRRGGTTTPS